jgi:hypothetical protein
MIPLNFFQIFYWILLLLYLGYYKNKYQENKSLRIIVDVLSCIILITYLPWVISIFFFVPDIFSPMILFFVFCTFLPVWVACLFLFSDLEKKENRNLIFNLGWVQLLITTLNFIFYYQGFVYQNKKTMLNIIYSPGFIQLNYIKGNFNVKRSKRKK